MIKKQSDFQIIFIKMKEILDEMPEESRRRRQAEIEEYDEIRVLRQIVMEMQVEPQVYFSTT